MFSRKKQRVKQQDYHKSENNNNDNFKSQETKYDTFALETESKSANSQYEMIENPSSCLVRNQVDGNKVKMILICPNGEQRLLTFDTSRDDCTVQDLLDQAKIPTRRGFDTFLVKDASIEANYIVAHVKKYSVSEEGSELSDVRTNKEQNELLTFGKEQSEHSEIRRNENQPETEPILPQDSDGGEIPSENQDMEYEYSFIEGSHILLTCRTVMIGSYSYTLRGRAIVSQSGVRFRAPHLEDKTNLVLLELKMQDILKLLVHFGSRIPVLFFWVGIKAADVIRQCLGMHDPRGPYYKPESDVNTQRRITLLVDEITEESRLFLKTLFTPNKIIEELNSKEADSLLWSISTTEIRPRIERLIINSKNITSTVRSTVNKEVKRLDKEVQSLTQVSERTGLAVKSTEDKKNDLFFKVPKKVLKRSRASAAISNNFANDEIQTLLVYPPPPARGGITISAKDLACLDESRFLNDVIIDFYLKYLHLQVLSEKDRNRTHIFSIHFYTRLTKQQSPSSDTDETISPAARRHANVRNWTKTVNIFEKDFIVIPINESAHWFLAIICFPGLVGKKQTNPITTEAYHRLTTRRGAKERKLQAATGRDGTEIEKSPCILIFDSLAGSSRSARSVIAILRDYLSCEYLAKFGTETIFSGETIKGSCLKVPQQNNFSDCGLYVLQYVESFFANPITDYTLPIKTLRDWFEDIVIIRKRKQLSNLLKELMKC